MADLGPFVPSCGPPHARIFILAEAPGSEESDHLTPLVGPSGQELRRMLRTIGLSLDDTYRCNVFSRQPPGNDLALGYGTVQPTPASLALGPLTTTPRTWIADPHLPELSRVQDELRAVRPNVVLALGNTACWALGLGQGIGQLRGSLYTVSVLLDRPLKVLPTYHPSAVLHQWDLRSIAIADMEKALEESSNSEARWDNSELWIEPTLDDLADFDVRHMQRALSCAVDIETKRGQITCIGFAPSPDCAIVIPFWQEGLNPHYWADPEAELEAWSWVRRWMERPDLTKIFQNGLYDLQYLQVHCRPRACTEDTMLQHHALYSELQKGLGFLGSIYTNTPSWKKMRTFKKEDILKRDD